MLSEAMSQISIDGRQVEFIINGEQDKGYSPVAQDKAQTPIMPNATKAQGEHRLPRKKVSFDEYLDVVHRLMANSIRR